MRIAYGDLIGGISGDMFVGALLDLGLSVAALKKQLKTIPTLQFRLEASHKTLHGIRASRFHVICPEKEADRSWKQIRMLIGKSRLSTEVKNRGLEIFTRLAEAEGKIHGVPAGDVHFHEIGATDSIVDIMAAAIGCSELDLDEFYFSPVPLGRGLTSSRHGILPVPTPAALELLKGIPTHAADVPGETVTPTGAAILRTLAKKVGDQPSMRIEGVGYGAGHKEFPNRPNLFRLIVGSAEPAWSHEEMLVIETNIDDMNPEFYDYVLERLFEGGARDVFLSPIQMKKNRPATLLRVIAESGRKSELAKILFDETSTIGIRYYPVHRMILQRKSEILKTRFGPVRIKRVAQGNGRDHASPEYDDLKRIASAKKIPLKILYDEVMKVLAK